MMANIENTIRNQGYMISIGGRIRHKPPPELNQHGRWSVPYYKMTCVLIQGSAAEILKKGLADAMDAGVFNVTPMHLSVHDENVISIPFNKTGTEAAQELIHCMEQSYHERLTVPLTSSCEVGPNWGYWKGDIWDEMKQGVFAEDAWNRVYAPKVKRSLWVIQNGFTGLDDKLTFIDDDKFSQ
jgi:DNA polymerase I-like protein with 3'-5' exonuclease and polymerase domains